jgi:hypothetical protein
MKTRFAKQRLMKTLKAEEVNGKAYKPIEEARGNIGIFIDSQRSLRALTMLAAVRGRRTRVRRSYQSAVYRNSRPTPGHASLVVVVDFRFRDKNGAISSQSKQGRRRSAAKLTPY